MSGEQNTDGMMDIYLIKTENYEADLLFDRIVTYPIYDLISDPIKKQEIKEVVQRYINSKKIDVIDIISVFRYYSNKHVDHMFATHWRGANDNGDVYEGIECYVYPNN
jgi:hypothetical protein|nr:MAG TPA: Gram-negative insecticidal protein, TOXIN.5A [Caudoviricetes sp.]